MKRIVLSILVSILAGTWAGAQNQLDFNNPAIPEVVQMQQEAGLVSGHSVCFSLLGLDYSYERALGGNWSLVGRAAASVALVNALIQESSSSVTIENGPVTQTTTNSSRTTTFYFGIRPEITLEPRYYTNLQRRWLKGKKNVNNSADFVSIKTSVYPANLHYFAFTIAPVYGIRRAGNHWYREYTFGLTLNTIAFKTSYPVLPHLGFRIGYTF